MLLLTLRGTPTLYYGDEIGMHNVAIPPDRVQDPFEKNVPGLGLGRDPCRTPMQWSAKENAGFSTAPTWLPLADDISNVNVEAEMRESHSILNLYRRLIELRRREPALAIGQYVSVPTTGDVLAYRRQHDDARRYLDRAQLFRRARKVSQSGYSRSKAQSYCQPTWIVKKNW